MCVSVCARVCACARVRTHVCVARRVFPSRRDKHHWEPRRGERARVFLAVYAHMCLLLIVSVFTLFHMHVGQNREERLFAERH